MRSPQTPEDRAAINERDAQRAAVLHTPLPFEHADEFIQTEGGYTVIAVQPDPDMSKGNEAWDNNAAFIVRACNNHYKLVEALRLATDQLEKAVSGDQIDTKTVNAILDRNALAEAEAA